MTEYIETGSKIPEETSEVERYMLFLEESHPMDILADNQKLVEKLPSYGDVPYKFVYVRNMVKSYISHKNKVRVTHYPESQGFPKKYFPMIGYEESPMVAIKLHLQENERLVHNFSGLSLTLGLHTTTQ